MAVPVPPPATNGGAAAFDVWVVGTQDEKIVMAKNPGAIGKDIRVAIDRTPKPDEAGPPIVSAEAFFKDDAGNKLTFIPEVLSTSDSQKLMVTGGEMMVTLLGKKTTAPREVDSANSAISAADLGIMVNLLANDGHLTSKDSRKVLTVRVDVPPSIDKDTSAVPTQLVDVGMNSDDLVVLIRPKFKDDRRLATELYFIVWSKDPTIVEVINNPTNKDGKVVVNAAMPTLMIKGLKVGETMIMVKAKEALDTSPPSTADVGSHANKEQVSSDVLYVNVQVRLPAPTNSS